MISATDNAWLPRAVRDPKRPAAANVPRSKRLFANQ